MMTSDDKTIKNPAPKNETPPKNKSTSDPDPAKVEGGEIAGALPSGYSRGEGQKPVSSRLLKKVLRGCRYATLIQIRALWRTKDSIERSFGF
jgi:hypothetical protein